MPLVGILLLLDFCIWGYIKVKVHNIVEGIEAVVDEALDEMPR